MKLSDIMLSFDETHHVVNGIPVYDRRFTKVMSFHEPGIAAVLDGIVAYHIDMYGQPVYTQRYKKTFGFYDGIAVVVDDDGWYHIKADGMPVYEERYIWAGNYQEGLCVVKDVGNRYFHIDRDGKRVYPESYAYAGDHKYGIAVVYDDSGNATHIDRQGRRMHDAKCLELGVYHKGYAIAKDAGGYFHIDKEGRQHYETRYAMVEPFYNGVAVCRTHDGKMVLRSEDNKTSVIQFPQDRERAIREKMAYVSRLIYEKGYNYAADGNISVRLSENEILISPSFLHKGYIKPEDFAVIDNEGGFLRGAYRQSTEYRLHLEVYKQRPEINAVIHVHAPFCVALTLARIDMMDAYITMKPAPTAEFARPSSSEGPEKIRDLVKGNIAILLDRHGAVTFSEDLWDAYIRLESLEAAAKIILAAKAAGPIVPFDKFDRERLFKWWHIKMPEEKGGKKHE